MLVLSSKDSLLRACHLRRRYFYGSNKGRGYYGMACADECPKSVYLHDFSEILSTTRQGFIEDSKSDQKISEEEQEVCLDREMHRSISRIKELLKTIVILKVLDMDSEFLVCTDTSKEGLGKVLMQDGRVVAYISRKLRRHEKKYVTHNL
jgi:hypothetical protein